MGHILATVGDDLFGGCRGPITQGDKGARGLPPLLIRAGDNGGLQDRGVTIEYIFDLNRRNIFLAAGDDDIFRAVL